MHDRQSVQFSSILSGEKRARNGPGSAFFPLLNQLSGACGEPATDGSRQPEGLETKETPQNEATQIFYTLHQTSHFLNYKKKN